LEDDPMRALLLASAVTGFLFCTCFKSQMCQAETGAALPQTNDISQVSVTFSGGYDTDPRDGGRPVILIASALKVSPDVFRNVFRGVHPAHGGGPTDAEARANKKILLDGLGPYGVTDDRLNEVSNYYRYAGFRGQMWRKTDAAVTATVRNGVVTGFNITNPGSGYSSPPLVSVAGVTGLRAIVKLNFGTDFKTNGSIKEITLGGDNADAPNAAPAVKTPEDRPAASPGRPPGGGAVQRALEQLKLSDEQTQKIEPLLRDYREKQQALGDELSAQLKRVLSPEEYQKFVAGLRQPPPPPPGDERPAPPPN
jgi:hypothetical protein